MRPIHAIADDIIRTWRNPYFGAVPYLRAMRHLTTGGDQYIMETGASIVAYFLANARWFRGPEAKRLKAELKAHIRDFAL